MSDAEPFALVVLITAVTGLIVIAASRLTERIKVPLPALVLVAAALAAKFVPNVHAPSETTVTRVVTVALVCVLFDGGMGIGWTRFRASAAPIGVVGVLGTFGTAALGSIVAHIGFSFTWYVSALIATAVAPTDPTVVFSVLGRRQIGGRSGTILEGESGANDPVGIALMASLIGAGSLSAGGIGHVAGDFFLQMVVGSLLGIVGGRILLVFMQRVPLPSEGLYPLRTLGAALALFGLATVAHGSGFLAVFVAGIVLGDERAPYKREIERFHGALGSLGEIVAFVVLGLTVDIKVLSQADVWVPGLVLGALLALVIRPLVVGLCLIPARLSRRERAFISFAGLKGAVPILLGSYLLAARIASAERLYGIIVIVVVFSVIVQGSLTGTAARVLGLPVVVVVPEPWTLGVRLRDEPENVHYLTVAAGSRADGSSVSSLSGLPAGAWVTLLVRDGQLLAVRGGTVLHAGDTLTVLTDDGQRAALEATFGPATR